MKEKKTAVITIRTTEEINEALIMRAEEKQWTKAQLAESIIREYIYGADETESEEAKEIIDHMHEKNSNLQELASWAISTNKFETFRLGIEVWKALIEEANKN